MMTRRRDRLARLLNEAALALIREARLTDPNEAAELAELATRIDQTRVGLVHRPGPEAHIEHWPLRTAA